MYTQDLIALDSCRPRCGMALLPPSPEDTINTSLTWSALEETLHNHPDRLFREYIVSGLKDGFRVGFNYEGHTCLE